MRRWVLAIVVVGLVGGGWLARGVLFQTEARQVEQILNQLAAQISFGPQEGNIASVRRISGVMDRFTADISIEIEILGLGTFLITGRDELQQRLMAAHREARRLTLKFHDPIVAIGEEGQTAVVSLTATAEAEVRDRTQDGFEAIEFEFHLRKVEGRWRVQKVTTVPTLKQ